MPAPPASCNEPVTVLVALVTLVTVRIPVNLAPPLTSNGYNGVLTPTPTLPAK